MADQGDGNHFAYLGQLQITPEFLVFCFTIIWEKIIVIISEKWTERISINQEWVEPRFA
jgi:hypothetical protein